MVKLGLYIQRQMLELTFRGQNIAAIEDCWDIEP
jgi:hypothetical protein